MIYRLMLVEDEPPAMRGIERALLRCPEAADVAVVARAQNGRQALDMVCEARPHMVLSDVIMPVMDGFQLAEQLRARHPQIQLAILSGHQEYKYVRKALQHSLSDYLLKPVDEAELSELLSRMKAAVRARLCDHRAAELSTEDVVRSIHGHIETHYQEITELQALAGQFGIAVGYLSTLYNKMYGASPSKHLLSVRIERAKELILRDESLPVREIAQRVGYSDPHYFSRLFHSVTGLSPSEYRQRNMEPR